jgi:RNA polymerase sigma-70 factor, ECF subfamily
VDSLNNADLIKKLQEGGIDALGELYDQHKNLVYRTALAITGDSEVASDLLQDVFLRLYRFVDRIDSQRPLEHCLYRMTSNLSYTWVKQNRRWIQPLDFITEWLTDSSKNQPDDIIEKQDDWLQVYKSVLRLPIQQRVVVVLYYLNDLSIDEISEILKVPVGTVKSRLYYGRKAIKKYLNLGNMNGSKQFAGLNYERSS